MSAADSQRWKLGQGMWTDENILDPVTFDDLILALKCNYGRVGDLEILAQAQEILEQRLDDYWYLIKNNFDEIAAKANGEEDESSEEDCESV